VREWPTRSLDGDHFLMLTDASSVADALVGVVAEMRLQVTGYSRRDQKLSHLLAHPAPTSSASKRLRSGGVPIEQFKRPELSDAYQKLECSSSKPARQSR
jgi:hypothetical protein